MKKSIWFYISVIVVVLTALFFLTSCQKSSLSLAKDTWDGSYVKDSVRAATVDSAKKLAFDCPGDRKWKADTILSYNHGEPQAVPTTWQEIHPGLMVYVKVREIEAGLFERLYFIYDHKKIS